MYDVWHGIVPVSAVDAFARWRRPTLSDRSARSGDTFARDRMLPPLAADARVAILTRAPRFGDEFRLQCAPAGGRSDGRRRPWSVIRDRPLMSTCGVASACHIGSNERPGRRFDRLLRRLAGRRALARFAILFERVWPALWPPLGVAGLFVCAALLDVPLFLPPACIWPCSPGPADDPRPADPWPVRIAPSGQLGGGPAAGAGVRPVNTGRWRSSPIGRSAKYDDPIKGKPRCGRRIWRAPSGRSAGCASARRIPGCRGATRYALRGALVVALIAACFIAGEEAPCPLAGRGATNSAAAAGATRHRIAGLDHPATLHPSCAGVPEAGGRCRVTVPSGSHLTVSVTGGSGTPSLALNRRAAFVPGAQ